MDTRVFPLFFGEGNAQPKLMFSFFDRPPHPPTNPSPEYVTFNDQERVLQ